jgi:hypothetical protein
MRAFQKPGTHMTSSRHDTKGNAATLLAKRILTAGIERATAPNINRMREKAGSARLFFEFRWWKL